MPRRSRYRRISLIKHVALAFIGVTLVILILGKAIGQTTLVENPAGDQVVFNVLTVRPTLSLGCEITEEAKFSEIVHVLKTSGFLEGYNVAKQFSRIKNADGIGVCGRMLVHVAIFEVYEEFFVAFPDGTQKPSISADIFAVAIGNDGLGNPILNGRRFRAVLFGVRYNGGTSSPSVPTPQAPKRPERPT